MVVEIAGQGSLGRRLPVNQNINEVPPQYWGISGPNFTRQPFPQFSGILNEEYDEGYIDYYAGYIRFNKRFSHGLNLIANYSWDKGIGFAASGNNQMADLYYPRWTRGLSIYDQANGADSVPIHMGTVSLTYSLPFGPGQAFLNRGIVGNLVGGWDLGAIFWAHSGDAFDIVSPANSLNGSTLGSFVNLVGNPRPSGRNPSNYLNASAFALPAFGTIGNECCDKFFSPNNAMLNTSLSKSFSLHEGYNLRLVAEIFNLFNSPQWGVPDTLLGDPGFGVITGPSQSQGANISNSQDGARIMQLGLRLDF
jgi:hypothetical protein